MDVILKQDVDKLGYKNDLVTVKPGYARNFLVPNGMAVIATDSAKKVRDEDIRQRAHREAKLIEEATALLSKIQGADIKVGAKAGEGDKIFGSVNSIQVAEAIKAATGSEVDRKKVGLKESTVKKLGKYTATVRLHKEVEGEFEFEVVAE
ncbi:MAG: 50S ribosomal protein L9 [Flavobacteriales bacterium]|nr:50S ribosomal protein L9 [Flavobacteriales bacterium]MCB9204346.1 50S ribosomal protein L9 [Flavobacteriales bacterium]